MAIALASRADTIQAKIASYAVAALFADHRRRGTPLA